MIPQSFINSLLDRLDIVEVIGAAVPLKKAGSNYVAACPFHSEKSGSFTVSPTKQFYHCFGCGAHGTALSFLIEYEGVGFVDAVERLAQSVGLSVPVEHKPAVTERQSSFDACSAAIGSAVRLYHQQLLKSEAAMAYLEARGLSRSTISEFQLGYATEDWTQLKQAFTDYSSNAQLVESGLVIDQPTPRPRRYDRLRSRIVFPIFSRKGQPIGLGGRVLDGSLPKYLNSPESVCFHKGEELYTHRGFQKAVRSEGSSLVVEGYLDVIQLFQHGFGHVAGTLGTATTAHHLRILFRLTDRVIFVFDGDKAGVAAAWRAMELALPHVTDAQTVAFVALPTEHDPDSFVRAHGADQLRTSISDAQPLSDFLLRALVTAPASQACQQRAAALSSALHLLSRIERAPLLRELILTKMALLVGVSADALRSTLPAPSVAGQTSVVFEMLANQPRTPAQRLFQLFSLAPDLLRCKPLRIVPFEDDGSAQLVELLRIVLTNPDIRSVASLTMHLVDSPLQALVAEAVGGDPVLHQPGFNLEAELEHALVQYKRSIALRELEMAAGLVAVETAQCTAVQPSQDCQADRGCAPALSQATIAFSRPALA